MPDKKSDAQEGKTMTALSGANTLKSLQRVNHRIRPIRVNRDKSSRFVAIAKTDGIRAFSVLSSRGQVVIPSEIRDVLKANKGDKVLFQTLDDHSMIVRIEKRATSDELFGVLQAQVPPQMRNQDWDKIRRITNEAKAEENRAKGLE